MFCHASRIFPAVLFFFHAVTPARGKGTSSRRTFWDNCQQLIRKEECMVKSHYMAKLSHLNIFKSFSFVQELNQYCLIKYYGDHSGPSLLLSIKASEAAGQGRLRVQSRT
jgi:hypothetical protein